MRQRGGSSGGVPEPAESPGGHHLREVGAAVQRHHGAPLRSVGHQACTGATQQRRQGGQLAIATVRLQTTTRPQDRAPSVAAATVAATAGSANH